MSDYDSVRSAASRLSVEDRLRLIDELASSVPDNQPPKLSDEWHAEIERRSREIDEGTVITESWEEVRAKLLARIEEKRAN